MSTFDSDKPMTMFGVSGRLTHRTTKPGQAPGLWFHQRWISEARPISGYGKGATLRVEARYDDECGNGHNSFAITAEVRRPGARDIEAGGCLHDEIAAIFPELAPLIPFHLVDSDGPMHYLANTLYHAGDRDHNGLKAGEKRQIKNGKTGLPAWQLVAIGPSGEELPIHELPKYKDAPEKPESTYGLEWRPWCTTGEGKARELDKARSSAVWPEATDEELCSPREVLEKKLKARLPALLEKFRGLIESAGFLWEPPA